MILCFCVLLLSSLFEATVGKDNVYPSVEGTNTDYKCGDDLVIEETNNLTRVTFHTSHFMNDARCTNEISNITLPCNIKPSGKEVIASFRGTDEHEGVWKCIFKSLIRTDVQGSVNGVLTKTLNCSLNVKVKRRVMLTISSDSRNATIAGTDDLVYMYFEAGANVSVDCRKYSEKSYLQSGSLIIKFCFNIDKLCSTDIRQVTANITTSMILIHNMTDSVLSCIYESSQKEKHVARIGFRRIEPPEIFDTDARMPKSTGSQIVFEGKVGTVKRYGCRKNTNYGSIHWDYCVNGTECRVVSRNANNLSIIYQDVTLKKEKNHTLKCVFEHSNNEKRTAAEVILNGIVPPVLSIGGRLLDQYNKTTLDTYVIKKEVGDRVGLRCSNQEESGYLHWKLCKRSTLDCSAKLDTSVTYEKALDRIHLLQLEDNNNFLYCVLRTPRGNDISTKIAFVVQPKAQTIRPSQPAHTIKNDRSTESDLSSSSERSSREVDGS